MKFASERKLFCCPLLLHLAPSLSTISCVNSCIESEIENVQRPRSALFSVFFHFFSFFSFTGSPWRTLYLHSSAFHYTTTCVQLHCHFSIIQQLSASFSLPLFPLFHPLPAVVLFYLHKYSYLLPFRFS